MILGQTKRKCGDFDGYYVLLGEVIKAAVADAQLARQGKTKFDSQTEFAEDWLHQFIEGSRYERSIIKLAGLQRGGICRHN